VIDIKKCGLSAFKQKIFVAVKRIVQEINRVADIWLQSFAQGSEVVDDLINF
jgi:hypothetical protein